MAVFTVLNGTGINGAGIQFGTLSQIASSGVAGFPVITPTTGTIFFNDTGLFSVTGTGMSFIFPSTFGGTVTSLNYSRPAITPIFSVTGMSTALATVADLIDGGAEEMDVLAAIFSGNDTMTGSTQGDWLFGFNGTDTLNGGGGADLLSGGAGADAINGGDGFDFARYDFSTAGVTIGATDGAGDRG